MRLAARLADALKRSMATVSDPLFRPAKPDRPHKFAPLWTAFIGERATNSVAGWPQLAFERPHMRRRFVPHDIHIISDPDGIKRVLVDNAANYQKPSQVRKLLSSSAGGSLITAEGDEWRKQRRLMAPAFTPGAVAAAAAGMAEVAAAELAAWPASGRLDVAAAATRTTFGIINRTLFSGEGGMGSAAAAGHIAAALAALGKTRLSTILGLRLPSPDPLVRRGEAGAKFLADAVTALVRRRQTEPRPPADFLQRLIDAFAAEGEPGEATQQAIDNAMAFFIAGHETTANTVTWTLYLLSRAGGWQERVAAEARLAVAGPAGALAAATPLLKRVIEESLRLYPAVPRFDRQAQGPDEVAGVAIKRGEYISIWPWLIHRHARLWDRPDDFDPDRWLPERRNGYHRFQYLPFGAGPRVCIGAQFATTEAQVILAHWLAAYRFVAPRHQLVTPTGDVTLKPRAGLRLQVERRV